MTEASLTLRSGHWSNDDYDVYDGDRVIGRIMVYRLAPTDRRWFWMITARGRIPSLSDRGYAASREQAMANFNARWDGPTAQQKNTAPQ